MGLSEGEIEREGESERERERAGESDRQAEAGSMRGEGGGEERGRRRMGCREAAETRWWDGACMGGHRDAAMKGWTDGV